MIQPNIEFRERLSLKDQVRLLRIAHETPWPEIREAALQVLQQACLVTPTQIFVPDDVERV